MLGVVSRSSYGDREELMIEVNRKMYYTIEEAAKVLEVRYNRTLQFVQDGRLKSIMPFGRRRLLLVEDVNRFARTRPRKPGPVPK